MQSLSGYEVAYFECGVHGNMTHLESRKMMEAAALTKAESGCGNVTENDTFLEAGTLIVSQCHSCFFFPPQ